MQVTLAYGRSGLAVELPEEWTDVVEPRDVAGLPDKPAAVSATLRAPLGTDGPGSTADPRRRRYRVARQAVFQDLAAWAEQGGAGGQGAASSTLRSCAGATGRSAKARGLQRRSRRACTATLPASGTPTGSTPSAPTISISASAAASTTASAPPSRGSRPPSRWENSYGGLTARASSSTRRRTVTTPLCVARDISLSTSTACEPEARGDDPGDGASVERSSSPGSSCRNNT